MRSFAEYRKAQLRRAIQQSNVQEGIQTHFEILRLDLLEAIRLPTQPQNSILAEVQYNQCRKQDYAENRYIVEQIIQVCKEDFLGELLDEARASMDAGTSLEQLRDELKLKIKKFLDDLKQAIGGAATTARDTDGSAPNVGGAPAGAGGGAPAGAGGGAPAGAGAAPADPSAGPAAPSSTDYRRWGDQRGEERPADSGGFKPAAYGSMRPSDGFMGGMGRLWRRVTRPVRRVWHGDPNREMAKEHTEKLHVIFNENMDAVLQMIGDFEVQIGKYIDQQIAKIVKIVGASVADPNAAVTGAVRSPQDVSPDDGPPPENPADAVQQDAEEEGDAAKDVALAGGATEEEAEEEKQEAIERKLGELAIEGARKIGIVLNMSQGKKGGWPTTTVPPTAFMDEHGQPLIAPDTPKPWPKLTSEIIKRAYRTLPELLNMKYTHDRAYTQSGSLAMGSAGARKKAILEKLGIPSGKAGRTFVINLLAAIEKQATGYVSPTPPQDDSTGPGDPGDLGGEDKGAVDPGAKGDPTKGTGAVRDNKGQTTVGQNIEQTAIAYLKQNDPQLFDFYQAKGGVEGFVQQIMGLYQQANKEATPEGVHKSLEKSALDNGFQREEKDTEEDLGQTDLKEPEIKDAGGQDDVGGQEEEESNEASARRYMDDIRAKQLAASGLSEKDVPPLDYDAKLQDFLSKPFSNEAAQAFLQQYAADHMAHIESNSEEEKESIKDDPNIVNPSGGPTANDANEFDDEEIESDDEEAPQSQEDDSDFWDEEGGYDPEDPTSAQAEFTSKYPDLVNKMVQYYKSGGSDVGIQGLLDKDLDPESAEMMIDVMLDQAGDDFSGVLDDEEQLSPEELEARADQEQRSRSREDDDDDRWMRRETFQQKLDRLKGKLLS